MLGTLTTFLVCLCVCVCRWECPMWRPEEDFSCPISLFCLISWRQSLTVFWLRRLSTEPRESPLSLPHSELESGSYAVQQNILTLWAISAPTFNRSLLSSLIERSWPWARVNEWSAQGFNGELLMLHCEVSVLCSLHFMDRQLSYVWHKPCSEFFSLSTYCIFGPRTLLLWRTALCIVGQLVAYPFSVPTGW